MSRGYLSSRRSAESMTGQHRAEVERVHAMILGIPTAKTFPGVQYQGVYLPGTQLVFPTHEGAIADGSSVDQHGDPELMMSFAEQYLSSYRALMPTGRLPTSVVEVMPALHLLVVAAELAIKADLMRSGKHSASHLLKDLFAKLDGPHRREADRRFARCEPNKNLRSAGELPQTISGVLTVYGASYRRRQQGVPGHEVLRRAHDEAQEVPCGPDAEGRHAVPDLPSVRGRGPDRDLPVL